MMKSANKSANIEYVAYYRVSTKEQGISGLGLDAQRTSVESFVESGNGTIIAEFTEVESGKRNDRPQLNDALKLTKKKKATLIIAKLDRLSRNLAFIATLQDSNVKFVCVDFPEADKTYLQVMAIFAQREREMISERTKAGLQAAKARGKVLGNPNLNLHNEKLAEQAQEFAESLRTTLTGFKPQGLSQRKMVDELNKTGVKTIRGKEWGLLQLQHVLKRLGL